MIRLALIGKGPWGKNYIRTIAGLSQGELPADAIKTRDYKELLTRSDIHGVIIATPPATHVSIATEFVKRGFPVLVEKPLATNHKEALQLTRLAQKKKTVAMVGHVFIYHSHIRKMKQELKTLGNVRYVLAQSMDNGPIRTDISALWDWGPHDISMAVYLFGKTPRYVSAWDLGSGMYVIRLTFVGGIEFVSIMGWGSPVKKREMTIVGENGSLFFDDVANPAKSNQLPLTAEITEFVSCIAKNREPATPLSDGVIVARILEKAEVSIQKQGKKVRI